MPRVRHFIRKFDEGKSAIPKKDLEKTPDLAPERFNHDKHGIVAIRRWLKENQPESYSNVKRTLPKTTPNLYRANDDKRTATDTKKKDKAVKKAIKKNDSKKTVVKKKEAPKAAEPLKEPIEKVATIKKAPTKKKTPKSNTQTKKTKSTKPNKKKKA